MYRIPHCQKILTKNPSSWFSLVKFRNRIQVSRPFRRVCSCWTLDSHPCLCKTESHQALFDSSFHCSLVFLSFHYFNCTRQMRFHGPVLKSCAGHDGLFCLAEFSRTWFIVGRWFMVRKLILNSASDCGWLKSRSPCRLFTSTLCQLEYF